MSTLASQPLPQTGNAGTDPPQTFHGYPLDGVPWAQRTRAEKVFKSSYEDNNTFKNNRIFWVDPFNWVYTTAFANKFRMPRSWIDDQLNGALALAWRMTSMGLSACGYGGNPESCSPSLTCQLDVYFDSKTPLPWNYTDVVRDNMIEGLTSDSYLPRLRPQSKWARYMSGLSKDEKGPILPTARMEMHYLAGGSIDAGGLRLWLFDREYEPGVVLLSYAGACPVFDGKGPGVINYHTEAEVVKTRGVNPQSVHTVEIPEAFIKKIRAIYLQQNKPNQEFAKRVYEDFLRSRGPSSPASATSH